MGNGFTHGILRRGNTHTAEGILRFVKRVLEIAPRLAYVFDVRLDAGYTSATADAETTKATTVPTIVAPTLMSPDSEVGCRPVFLTYAQLRSSLCRSSRSPGMGRGLNGDPTRNAPPWAFAIRAQSGEHPNEYLHPLLPHPASGHHANSQRRYSDGRGNQPDRGASSGGNRRGTPQRHTGFLGSSIRIRPISTRSG